MPCDLHRDLLSEVFGKRKENEVGRSRGGPKEKAGKKPLKGRALCYSWPHFTDEKADRQTLGPKNSKELVL